MADDDKNSVKKDVAVKEEPRSTYHKYTEKEDEVLVRLGTWKCVHIAGC